ncbi:hypothetical protein BJX63DRAFT_432865 [Aspergillus granulosus]|uniref:Extracellular membrane protein CFEM domain-containing protein n=1 Tax=Aspergillus granulosus TaxID=176169 RepID=A0ABR4HB92_9EURO
MKFSLVALSSVLALVAAQESSSTTSSPPATTSLTAAEQCVLRCDTDDICCKAECVEVPCPSDSQANDTNDCVSNCDQGDGSEAAILSYANCQASCYSTHFFPATATGGAGASSTDSDTAATTTGSSDDSNSDDSNSDDSNSDSESSSESDAPSSTSDAEDPEDTNAASVAQIKLGASAAGLAGFLMVAWAL